MPDALDLDRLHAALRSINRLLHATQLGERHHQSEIDAVPHELRGSASNLAHYLAVRSLDLRSLQSELHDMSLSSLGRMESHVQSTLRGVRRALLALIGENSEDDSAHQESDSDYGMRLPRNAAQLLGRPPADRGTLIMVTLPSRAAFDRELVASLLRSGMDVARINLAHDAPAEWSAMVQIVREEAAALGRSCRVMVDLPGPKLRTCGLPPGPRVLHVHPQRNLFGKCTSPASVHFVDPGTTHELGSSEARIALTLPMLLLAREGDELRVHDARGRRRSFLITAIERDRCTATSGRPAYIVPGNRINLRREGRKLATSEVADVPAHESHVGLHPGDQLALMRNGLEGHEVRVLDTGEVEPKCIGCTLPEVFDAVHPGQRILFDDGKVEGLVVSNQGDRLLVDIVSTPPGGAKLRAAKGINLPDTELEIPALPETDRELLKWVAENADIVGMSFVQRAEDVLRLEQELHERGRTDIGVVLKIETAVGFSRLPELLFAGLRNPPLGVMVARGDLAVEVGYERLAEVQEEILWLCEAAHVPVIWATQVLDGMARTGMPSRAEITDAAMSARAECVMLNKGPFVVETVRFLSGVLARMQQHASKKRWLLRRLGVAGDVPGLRESSSLR